eukprot:1178101-Prorocentrum_minimum.AAC.2
MCTDACVLAPGLGLQRADRLVQADAAFAEGAIEDADAKHDGLQLVELRALVLAAEGEEAAQAVLGEDGVEGGEGLGLRLVVGEGGLHPGDGGHVGKDLAVELREELRVIRLGLVAGGGDREGLGHQFFVLVLGLLLQLLALRNVRPLHLHLRGGAGLRRGEESERGGCCVRRV